MSERLVWSAAREQSYLGEGAAGHYTALHSIAVNRDRRESAVGWLAGADFGIQSQKVIVPQSWKRSCKPPSSKHV